MLQLLLHPPPHPPPTAHRAPCACKLSSLVVSACARAPQALAAEGLANYFTRRSPEAAQRLWAELLRLLLSAAGPTAEAPQLYFLSDATTVAVMQRWPEDRVRLAGCRGSSRCGRLAGWRALHTQRAAAAVPTAFHKPPCLYVLRVQAGWHPYSALLRMGKIVPWGKWR